MEVVSRENEIKLIANGEVASFSEDLLTVSKTEIDLFYRNETESLLVEEGDLIFFNLNNKSCVGQIIDIEFIDILHHKLIVKTGMDLLQANFFIRPGQYENIEQLTETLLTKEFVVNEINSLNLPIQIKRTTKTSGWIFSPTRVLNSSDYFRSIARLYNVYISIEVSERREIIVTIENKEKPSIIIDEIDEDYFIQTNILLAEEDAQMLEIQYLDKYELAQERKYFINTFGRITRDIAQAIIPKSSKKKFIDDVIDEEDLDVTLDNVARQELELNYNNEINVVVSDKWLLLMGNNFSSWLNVPVTFITKKNRKSIPTMITKVSFENNQVSLTLGTARSRLTDLLQMRGVSR